MMKRCIIYFFTCTYLFTFTEARQVMKIPNLVEHYIFHKISNNNTSFFSFFKLHYLDEQVLDADYHQDMKLPFKIHEVSFFAINLITIPEHFAFVIKVPPIFKEKTPILSYCQNYASNPLGSIFRPPILV